MSAFGNYNRSKVASRSVLTTATLRDFSGLWNASDTDLNLQSRYLPVMTNILPDNGTGMRVRPGYSKWVALDDSQVTNATIRVVAGSNILYATSERTTWPVAGSIFEISEFTADSLGGIAKATINGFHRSLGYEDEHGKEAKLLLSEWATSDATHVLTVRMRPVAAPGNIVDMVYFDNQILAVTDEGWLIGIEDTGKVYVWWSPFIDKAQNTNTQNDALFDWDIGSVYARITIDDADGNPSVDDVITPSAFSALGDWTAAEINRPHKIVEADKTNNIYTIKMPRPGTDASAGEGAVAFPVNSGWHYSDLVTHDNFNRGVVFTNGIDKPIKYTASPEFEVNYLSDPSNDSNLYVPIGKFFAAGTNYAVLAHSPDGEQGYVHIASTGTDNTWMGAPPPNDATFINLANVAGTAQPAITGIAFFNDKLIAAFSDSTAVYTLGTFNEEDHEPVLAQVFDAFGAVSHRSMVTFGENFLACDGIGVVDVARNTLDGSALRVHRVSEIIVKHISAALGALSDNLLQRVWALHDKRDGRVYMFVPDGSNYLCYCYTKWPERKIEGWSLIRGWNFSTGCRTLANRLFAARGRTIYRIGNELEPIHSDNGAAISFAFETPWIDFDHRMLSKTSRYISLDGEGEGEFTVQMFADYLYQDVTAGGTGYNELTRPLSPLLEMGFVSGDSPGYGAGAQPFGGGRRANDPRLYAWVGEFKIAKFRVYGSTTKPLRFVALSLAYQKGSIR